MLQRLYTNAVRTSLPVLDLKIKTHHLVTKATIKSRAAFMLAGPLPGPATKSWQDLVLAESTLQMC